MESEIRENHQVFRRVQLVLSGSTPPSAAAPSASEMIERSVLAQRPQFRE
jgi:hypothetical protein